MDTKKNGSMFSKTSRLKRHGWLNRNRSRVQARGMKLKVKTVKVTVFPSRTRVQARGLTLKVKTVKVTVFTSCALIMKKKEKWEFFRTLVLISCFGLSFSALFQQEFGDSFRHVQNTSGKTIIHGGQKYGR